MTKTIQCVYCLKQRAIAWCGHVIVADQLEPEMVLAGWCRNHEPLSDTTSFRGHYLMTMQQQP